MNENNQAVKVAEDGACGPMQEGQVEIDLLDILLVLARNKKTILLFTGGVAILAIVFSLLKTPIYTATTRILPPQQNKSAAAAVLGQLGGLAGGAGAALGIKNPNDLYIGMLKSRTIADALVTRFDLKTYYDQKFFEGARKRLGAQSDISAGKEGIIVIEVEDESPKLAAQMANAYVEELDKLQGRLAVTEAAQRRVFYEQELKRAGDRLVEVQVALRTALESGGIVLPEEHGRSLIEATARLRAEIAAKEIQIGTMRSFAADSNPDLVLAQNQLATMRSELAKLEGVAPEAVQTDKGSSKISGKPDLTSVQRMQEVKYYQTLYELLAKQYELARLDEAKEPALIQVLDVAVEPERRSSPKRGKIVVLSTLAAFFVSMLWVLLRHMLGKAREVPANRNRMDSLRAALRFR